MTNPSLSIHPIEDWQMVMAKPIQLKSHSFVASVLRCYLIFMPVWDDQLVCTCVKLHMTHLKAWILKKHLKYGIHVLYKTAVLPLVVYKSQYQT